MSFCKYGANRYCMNRIWLDTTRNSNPIALIWRMGSINCRIGLNHDVWMHSVCIHDIMHMKSASIRRIHYSHPSWILYSSLDTGIQLISFPGNWCKNYEILITWDWTKFWSVLLWSSIPAPKSRWQDNGTRADFDLHLYNMPRRRSKSI